jgi:hypothetical protein
VSVYERREALNIGRCGVDASQPRNFSIGVCYLKSVCGRRIGRLLDTLRMLELQQSGLDITLTIRMGDTRRAPNSNRSGRANRNVIQSLPQERRHDSRAVISRQAVLEHSACTPQLRGTSPSIINRHLANKAY